jgi:hypothetical protein
MQGMRPRIGSADGALARALRGAAGLVLALSLAAIAGGCMNSIQTPLPDMIRPPAKTALSDKERKEAVDELAKKRDTHEQDAQQQIEQSR